MDRNYHRYFAPLTNLNFLDIYRELYSEKIAFTWTNGSTATRIDQIWMSEEAAGLVKASFVSNAALITDSDHQIFMMIINISDLISNNWASSRLVGKDTFHSEK